MIKYDFLQLLVNLLRFSQDNVTLALNCLGFKLRVLENIGKNIDSCGYIGIESFSIIYGVLTLDSSLAYLPPFQCIITYRCVCIQMTTHVFDFKFQLLLGSVLGTLFVCQS